jgi:selenocysteine-specific elongation factor
MSYTIVGVIGHIDHGKTSLVGVLTGVDTDTHPEEKRRGITIDLGFASFTEGEHEFALIDAPGHQKYIGNLLAGVSGIDVGLLVVACDQGIQAQTLEHAAILQTLGVEKLIAAISRIDLSSEARKLELSEELEVFLADYGFSDVPTIPFSSVTGEGIDKLKSQLCHYARSTERSASSFFRMPIDRVFTVPGRGCVVAGTLWSGSVAVGDTVEVAGENHQPVRVRELEVHGDCVQQSTAGHRTAMNVTGVSARDLCRGDELVAQGTNRMRSRLVVEVRVFADAVELKCPATVQFHSATTACSARITGVRQLTPGEKVVAILDTEEPIVATFAQQFLLRCPYPVGSFGGGRILAPIDSSVRRRGLIDFGESLVAADAVHRLQAWTKHLGELPIDPMMLELHLGIPGDRLTEVMAQAIDSDDILMPIPQTLVSAAAITRAGDYILKVLTEQAQETEDAWAVEESIVQRVRSTASSDLAHWVIQRLIEEKKLVRLNKMIAVASDENRLTKKQKARMNDILQLFDGVRTPPTIKEIADQTQTRMDTVASLVRFATQQRVLIDLGAGFLISSQVFSDLCRELRELFDEQAEQPVAAIRDRWQVTRKHAIPFLEYCDRVGVTSRHGNARSTGPNLQQYLAEQAVE